LIALRSLDFQKYLTDLRSSVCLRNKSRKPEYVTDYPVVKVHVDELSSARIGQHKLCATLSANINIDYRLSHQGILPYGNNNIVSAHFNCTLHIY
jgi:hypothetical protein